MTPELWNGRIRKNIGLSLDGQMTLSVPVCDNCASDLMIDVAGLSPGATASGGMMLPCTITAAAKDLSIRLRRLKIFYPGLILENGSLGVRFFI